MSDPRIKKTRDKLGDALIDLLREKPFDEITVQHVLDRAQVGRSTFYAHFKDKRDLLVSDFEDFLQLFARAPKDGRVFAVRELIAHVREQQALLDQMREADLLLDFLDLAEATFAKALERKFEPNKARALSATLLSLMRHGKGTPDELDNFFHSLI